MENKKIINTLISIIGVESVEIEYPPHTLSDRPVSFIIKMETKSVYRFNSYFFGLCPVYLITENRRKERNEWTREDLENQKNEKLACIKIQSLYHDIFGKERNKYRKHHLLSTLAYIHWSQNKSMIKQMQELKKEAKNGCFSNTNSGAIEEYLLLFYPELKIRCTHLAFAYLIDPDDIWPTEEELNEAIADEAEMQATKIKTHFKPWQEIYGTR